MSQHHIKISGGCTYYRGAAWFLAWCWIAIYSDPQKTLPHQLQDTKSDVTYNVLRRFAWNVNFVSSGTSTSQPLCSSLLIRNTNHRHFKWHNNTYTETNSSNRISNLIKIYFSSLTTFVFTLFWRKSLQNDDWAISLSLWWIPQIGKWLTVVLAKLQGTECASETTT